MCNTPAEARAYLARSLPHPSDDDYDFSRVAAIDFDGTLFENEWTPQNPTRKIGAPMWKNLVKMADMIGNGWRVIIHTARSYDDYASVVESLEAHGFAVDGHRLSIVMSKPMAYVYIDDRALNVEDW